MGNLFSEVKRQMQLKNYCNGVFTFVDSSALISKLNLWEEHDKAITAGYEKLNAVDMQSGMITRVAATSANVTDSEGVSISIYLLQHRQCHPRSYRQNKCADL